jgi:hypothetical protein
MTKPVDLESLEALRAEATSGEWEHEARDGRDDDGEFVIESAILAVPADGLSDTVVTFDGLTRHADAALIVALVNAFPAMAAELRALRDVAAAARELRGNDAMLGDIRRALAALSETP